MTAKIQTSSSDDSIVIGKSPTKYEVLDLKFGKSPWSGDRRDRVRAERSPGEFCARVTMR